jgi:glucokinase
MTTQPGSEDALYVGVDLGGNRVSGGLVDAAGRIVEERHVDTDTDEARALVGQLSELVRELQDAPVAEGRVRAVGVGLPGLVNTATNRVVVLPNLPDLSSVDVYGEISRSTGLPVVFDNDASAAAYGELHCGAGIGARSLLYVHIGTGIGSGLVLDGKIWRGANGYAGEFGHMTIEPEDGIECACGNVGCLETVCSAPNIVRRLRERLYRDRTSSLSRIVIPRDREFGINDIVRAAVNGDDMAQLIMDRTGMFLGIALAGAINLLNVEVVVMGGDVMEAGDQLLRPIIEHTRRRAFRPSFDSCRIVAAGLGRNSGVVGAALLARDGA